MLAGEKAALIDESYAGERSTIRTHCLLACEHLEKLTKARCPHAIN